MNKITVMIGAVGPSFVVAMRSITQEESLVVTMLYLSHAIEVRLHTHKADVVILTQETTDSIWWFSCSPSLSVGFSIQDEAMNVARSAPQGAHYHADVINWDLRRERGNYSTVV